MSQDVKLTDLYKYLRNPYNHLGQIHRVSRYITNKHGIIKDVLRTLKSLPDLNYNLIWSSYDDPKRILKNEDKVEALLSDLDINKMIRDGLYEVAELGTVAMVNRKNKYVQFLELDEIDISKQRNGKWIVDYDLASLHSNVKNKVYRSAKMAIQSLPSEVNYAKYNNYMGKRDDSARYVEIKNADVVNIDSNRNYPFGLPFSFGAWLPLLQKEIINRVERSVSDRLIKQVVILQASNITTADGKSKPPSSKVISHYHKEMKELMLKKDNQHNFSDGESGGSGLVALPDFLKLDTLNVDTKMFTKDLYEKIDRDIYQNLGISSAMNSGDGANYSSSQVNSEKFQKYIYTIVEQFETIINGYIENILPKNISCRIKFRRPTFADDKQIEAAKKQYESFGVARPYIELASGMSIKDYVAMKRYEDEVLEASKYLKPPENFYTQNGNSSDDPGESGRPPSENPTDNTTRSNTNGGNNVPSPSDG